MPTDKSTSIDNLITSITGISRQDAATQSICVWCKKPIFGFTDDLSVKEYNISGMCQSCQDETFGE